MIKALYKEAFAVRILNDHIKKGEFKKIYLIYGPEAYLRKQYRDRLHEGILDIEDTMNYSYYEGKGLDVRKIIEMADTLPFFSERRLIVVENSNFFASSQDELNEYLKCLSPTTSMVFVEEKVDKRNKLFKTVSSLGYAANMLSPNEKELTRWIGNILKEENKKADSYVVMQMLSLIDTDMENIRQELEKLISYTMDKEQITLEDVKAVCSIHTENKIFDMIHAISVKNQQKALELYYDLIKLREPPMRILFLIARQFNLLLQIKELSLKGYVSNTIAERMGTKEFIVRKNISLCRNFDIGELKRAVTDCVDLEEAVKTGRLNDRLAAELIINKYVSGSVVTG